MFVLLSTPCDKTVRVSEVIEPSLVYGVHEGPCLIGTAVATCMQRLRGAKRAAFGTELDTYTSRKEGLYHSRVSYCFATGCGKVLSHVQISAGNLTDVFPIFML